MDSSARQRHKSNGQSGTSESFVTEQVLPGQMCVWLQAVNLQLPGIVATAATKCSDGLDGLVCYETCALTS